MKTVPTILFAVNLLGLVYFTSSQPLGRQHREFKHFLYRLENAINATCVGFLPFTLPVGVIQNLRLTSDEFKKLCLEFDAEHFVEEGEILSPIAALEKTIYSTFDRYKKSANTNNVRKILEEIETVDPIGLNVYLTKNNVANFSPMFMGYVTIFMKTMQERVKLFKMKAGDYEHLQKLPNDIRSRIATEYSSTPHGPIDMFTDLVTELTSNKMYRIRTNDLTVYQEHNSSETDDVQLIYATYLDEEENRELHHAVCFNYRASTKKVHVYDSLMDSELDDRQEDIISILYPFSIGVAFETPSAIQDDQPTCAIFAVEYATMLLLKRDPAITPIKLNKVHGDETLYMRMHILNMLATRKLSLLE